ncbi:MAG TPA: FtsX-like permease family protein, partial [Ferruginibacter sp.]|nr:FtsX-like permease family protein [Ferruginibacter sp.]
SIRFEGNPQTVLSQVSEIWRAVMGDLELSSSFVEQNIAAEFAHERVEAQLLISFSVLAIIIACLGLYGSASFAIDRRTKEIGIRKVMGASVASVVGLLSKDFLKLVFVAIIIASPLAWYAMNKWLQDFAYRINLAWWIFLLAGFIAVLIAFVTISFQAIRSANANPVKSLRTE